MTEEKLNRLEALAKAAKSGSLRDDDKLYMSSGPDTMLSLIALARKGLVADRLSAVAHEANEVALKQHLPHLSSLPKPGGE